jgi:hypothetical protein
VHLPEKRSHILEMVMRSRSGLYVPGGVEYWIRLAGDADVTGPLVAGSVEQRESVVAIRIDPNVELDGAAAEEVADLARSGTAGTGRGDRPRRSGCSAARRSPRWRVAAELSRESADDSQRTGRGRLYCGKETTTCEDDYCEKETTQCRSREE